MNKTKIILVSGLVGLIIGSIISFFVVSSLQLSASSSQTQARQKCAKEESWLARAQRQHQEVDSNLTFNIVLNAWDAYNDCMGYLRY